MRIDVYLAKSGMLSSRNEAQSLISEGAVFVDGKQITKPSFCVDGFEDRIFIDKSKKQFVSRGGVKLHGALKSFSVSVEGKLCIDIGASSGGFTDCLLQNGAKHVICVDSGRGQLVASILGDERVTSIENYNARYMKPSDFEYFPEFAVMDVSFISATYIIPALSKCLREGADYILLIKPQFEVGKDAIGKGGIVKDEKARIAAVNKVVNFAKEHGFECKGIIQSSIKGGDGNVEFLAHFIKKSGFMEQI